MKTDELTKDEKSLLLYFETRIVDFAGRVDMKHLNNDDVNTVIPALQTSGLVKSFSRITAADIAASASKNTHAVFLTDEGYELAYKLRRERADRQVLNKNYTTTEEKREAS